MLCELVDLLMVVVVAWASVFEARKDFTIIYALLSLLLRRHCFHVTGAYVMVYYKV